MKIHKLRLDNRAAYEAFIAPYLNEDGAIVDERIKAISIVGETGLIPYPTEFDEEGNPLPLTFRDGFHVDVMTTEVIQEWKDYTVTGEHHWYHSFGYGEVVKEEDFE